MQGVILSPIKIGRTFLDMTELDLKIAAVEFALRSFAQTDNKEIRIKTLRASFLTIKYLDTYFLFTVPELKSTLQQLQQLKINDHENRRAEVISQGNS